MAKSSASRLVQIGHSSVITKAKKISKANALYVHFSGEEYDCDDCALWLTSERCIVHRSNFDVRGKDSCGFMIQGSPDTFRGRPHLNMDPDQTGFVRNIEGGGCSICKHFGPRDCELVDKDSDGDDPGEIHPRACCALQEKK